jgi:hypothetical protein
MPSHDSLYLLYATYSLLHALCIPFQNCDLHRQPRATAKRWRAIRESLVTNQYTDLYDHRWSQALLPLRWSGLGILRVISLALCAYMASAASTAELELTSSLLYRLDCAKSLTVECKATTMSAWIMLTSCRRQLLYIVTRVFHPHAKRAQLAPSENQGGGGIKK